MLNFLPVYLDKQESFTPKKYKLSHGQDSTTFNQQMAPSWHNLWMKDLMGKTGQSGKILFFAQDYKVGRKLSQLIPTTIFFTTTTRTSQNLSK